MSKPSPVTLLNPTEFEIDSLSWIWVALPSVSAQIPPPPPPVDPTTLSDEERKEYEDKQKNAVAPPTVLEPQQMFIATMKRALDTREYKASCAEIVDQLLPSIHRACFPNADESDNRAAAQEIADNLEADLLRHNSEISLRDFAHLLYRRVVHPAGWLPPVDFVAFANEEAIDARDDGGRSVMGGGGGAASVAGDRRATKLSRHLSTGTPRGQAAIAVATPLVKQFRDLAQCILDAPNLTTEPRLLPLSRVLSLTTVFDQANKIPVNLTTFVDLDPQREYAKVYDDMWDAISTSSSKDSKSSTEAGFQEWFGLFLSFTVPNAMEERSRVAAAAHYRETFAISMSFDAARFRQLAQDLFRFYTKRLVTNITCVEHFEKMMHLADGNITRRLEASQSDIIAPVLEKLKFTTVDALYAADNLSAEENLDESVYPTQTMNRILVTGLEGLVSIDYCKQLAQRLNIEHIDVLELLVKAYDDSESEASQTIRACIEEEKPIPLELQASLVHSALNKESTKFRGYVFGELPPALQGDGSFVDIFLAHSGLCDAGATPPRVVVEATCPSSSPSHKNSENLYRVWRAKYRDQIAAVYSAELAIRDKEFADKEAKAAKVERKDAARKRREDREETREKIARGEIAPLSEEEQEHEAHLDAEDQAIVEEEDEVDPDTLDEHGNMIDPDELPKVKEAKAAAKKRRSDIAEIHRLYHASRTCDLSSPQNAAYKENETLGAVVAAAKKATQKYLRVACFDSAETLVNFTCAQLQLHPTITPRVSALPADVLAGYESSPDADAATGEQFQQDLLAAGYRRSAYGDFCPVTKFEDSVLVSGTWFYSCSYREYCYCFASKEKLDKFAANPHKYLSQDVNSRVPVFLLQENFDVLEQAGISAAELHRVLGERLKLSCRSLSKFADNWNRFDAEVARRAAIEVARKQSDAAERKDREARFKAATAEAELAAKKNARAGGAKAKTASPTKTAVAATGAAGAKAGAKGAAAAAALAEQQRREKELAEAHAKAFAISDVDQAEIQDRLARAQAALVDHPVTTESRFAHRVAAEQKRALTSMRPLIISALESWNVDELQTFRARHVLPDVVVCFQNIKPPVLDADGNPIVSEEDEVNEDDENNNNTNNARHDDEDDEGNGNNNNNRNNNAKNSGSTDPSLDPKKSRSFWHKFLAELEEESQTVLGETGGDPPEHDGHPQQQPFRVVRINVHDLTLSTIVDMVLYNIREIGFKCDPNAGGTELQVEEDEDDDADAEEEDDEEYANLLATNPLIERRDPILRARARAVHQFGETSIYCPVALVRDGLLVRGDPSIWTQLNGRKFIFATAANMEAFKLLPKRYIPASPPQAMPLPPPRVWLFGPTAGGKDTVADHLCEQFGLKRFSAHPEKLLAYLAAATDESLSDEERVVDGVSIPLQYPFAPAAPGKSNVFQHKHLADAIKIKKELDEFSKSQDENKKRKEQAEKDVQEREQWLDDGEEVEELTEAQQNAQQAALDWEPEDDDVKAERLASAHRRLASALSRIEPWATSGYLLVGEPNNDAELNGLLDAQMIPETTIRLTMGVEAFLERRFKDELAARQAEYQVKIRNFRMKQSALQLFARVAEITKWRRRNIGADDAASLDPPELEDADNEPEPVDAEAVRADLEQKFEATVADVEALVELLPERRIPVVSIRGDDGLEAVFASASQVLARNLLHRASFLENPQVITIDDANDRLEKVGRNLFSAFGKEDPVVLYERRNMGLHNDLYWAEKINSKNRNQLVLEEPAYVEPEPEVANHDDDASSNKKNKNKKERKTKMVEDDDGNEIEVTDHDADADEEEETHEPEPEPQEDEDDEEPPVDPFADLEEYPADLSPEEIEEMQAELNAIRKKRADRKGRRACILYNRVYFFDNDRSLKKFLTGNCRLYTEQPPPLPKVLGNVVAVQAHDDVLVDDKSRTVESIALNAGNSVFLSLPKLVEWGCSQTHFARLQEEAIAIAIASEVGSDVPDAWIEEALACRLLSADVQQNGCVLCNLPRTSEQLQNLLSPERINIVINTVLIFNSSAEDSINVPIFSAPAENRIRVFTSELGHTIRAVRSMKSPVGTSAALHEASTVLSATLDARRRIISARRLGFPLVADDAALEESFVLSNDARCPQYSYYCPWTWARESRLLERDPKSDLIQDPMCAPRKNVVEFLSKLYFFSDIPGHIEEFLAYPERFIGEKFRPKPLPKVLPHRLVHDKSRSTASSSAVALDSIRDDQIELCGFCPVVLCDTRRNRGLMGLVEPKAVPGKKTLIAEYDAKFYSMSSEENMQRFLSEPWTFVDGAVLPAADQFPQQGKEADLQSASLDMFLRRALRESVARAMCDVERIRPKFPGISVQQSALRFIALHIRTHHPDPHQSEFSQRVHAENYQQFVELATMAREGGLVPPADDAAPEVKAAFEKRCRMWDELLDNPQAFYERFSGLRTE